MQRHMLRKPLSYLSPLLLIAALAFFGLQGSTSQTASAASVAAPTSAEDAFAQAAAESGVPESLLKALCYLEGRLSMHGGSPSIDNGFGCMHLVKNKHADTLDQAAQLLKVSPSQLKGDLATNIRGGAAVLRASALSLSSNQSLPTSLAGWYGATASYSHATTRSTALAYADAVYKLVNSGFVASTDKGESVTLTAQAVHPLQASAAPIKGASTLPAGCVNDGKTDYPGAIDCILDPAIFDCNLVSDVAPCTYDGANRPTDFKIDQVAIHDIEGTVQDALNVFQDPNSFASVQYIVDSDGTVYQVVHEKDIPFGVGNFWYNEHSVNIEHAGFDATGFQWYNAAEYLGSAKLVAYLLKKYHLPLDHNHVVAHGTVPSPAVQFMPNHVDPGPYWLWDYYFNVIHKQGIAWPKDHPQSHIITLQPRTDQKPFGKNGTETPANFNFFYIYNGPSTASGLVPAVGGGTDITDETNNVEARLSYYYLAKVKDPAGTGDTMYEIWYGESDQAHANPSTFFMTAHLVWLAVPPNTAFDGNGTTVSLHGVNGAPAEVYGRPTTTEVDHVGDAANASRFVSAYKVVEDGTTNVWYEINYNHREAWVPASEVTVIH